jgi:Holliday junction resolvase-like predicted endonuclease
MKKMWTRVPESDIEKYLVKRVMDIGGECIKGNAHNSRGMTDRIAILPKGLVVFIEVKRPGLKPRPNQRVRINQFRKMGHVAVYVNTFKMIDALILWMQRHMSDRNVVGTDQVCNRVNCVERMAISWKEYVSK